MKTNHFADERFVVFETTTNELPPRLRPYLAAEN
jgi:hypothetical protein